MRGFIRGTFLIRLNAVMSLLLPSDLAQQAQRRPRLPEQDADQR